jgi:hypothetical protein
MMACDYVILISMLRTEQQQHCRSQVSRGHGAAMEEISVDGVLARRHLTLVRSAHLRLHYPHYIIQIDWLRVRTITCLCPLSRSFK